MLEMLFAAIVFVTWAVFQVMYVEQKEEGADSTVIACGVCGRHLEGPDPDTHDMLDFGLIEFKTSTCDTCNQ